MSIYVSGMVKKAFSIDSLLLYQTYVEPSSVMLEGVNMNLRRSALKILGLISPMETHGDGRSRLLASFFSIIGKLLA